LRKWEASSIDFGCSNWPIVDSDGNNQKAQAVILGLGSMFNHSAQDQNVVWERDTERLIITYTALRDIPVGEELCKWRSKMETLITNKERHIVWQSSYFQGRRCATSTTS
jgi:hypothetical protein